MRFMKTSWVFFKDVKKAASFDKAKKSNKHLQLMIHIYVYMCISSFSSCDKCHWLLSLSFTEQKTKCTQCNINQPMWCISRRTCVSLTDDLTHHVTLLFSEQSVRNELVVYRPWIPFSLCLHLELLF